MLNLQKIKTNLISWLHSLSLHYLSLSMCTPQSLWLKYVLAENKITYYIHLLTNKL